METATTAEGMTERELQILRAQLNFLQQHGQGIELTTNLLEVEDAEALEDEPFFAQLLVDDRLAFFEGLWNEDTFISAM